MQPREHRAYEQRVCAAEVIIGGIRNLISRIFGGSGPTRRGPEPDPLVEIASLIVKRGRQREVLLRTLASSGNTCVALGLVFEYLEGETDVSRAAEVLRAITTPAVVNVFKRSRRPHDCLALDRMLATACRYCTLYCDPQGSESCSEEELKDVCLAAVDLCDYLLLPLAERKPDQSFTQGQLAMVTRAVDTVATVLGKMQRDWAEEITRLLPLFMERVTGIVAERDLGSEGLRRALLRLAKQVPGAVEAASRHDVRAWHQMLQSMCLGPERDKLTPSSRLWRYLVGHAEYEAYEYAKAMTAAMLCFLRRQPDETQLPDVPCSEATLVAGSANAFIEQCCAASEGAAEQWESQVRPLISSLADEHRDTLVRDCKAVHEYLCKMLVSIDRLSDPKRVFRVHDRARISIEATITGGPKEDYPGNMISVSRTGCFFRFYGGPQVDMDADSFPRASLTLKFEVEGQPCSVGIARAVEHKHRKAAPGELVLGLRFSERLPDDIYDLLVQKGDGILV